jgi:SAM-dependent methyltransferase
MRKTYRDKKPADYWTKRWNAIPADAPAEGEDRYPLLYSNMVITRPDGAVLELGCGPGRLVRYYHARGVEIIGVDSIAAVVQKLKACDPELNVVHADARALPFEDDRFEVALCFGVYHSLDHDASKAVAETFRVLRPGGRLCAEFRADSLHNRLIDMYKGWGKHATEFHKWNYRDHEARSMLVHAGFEVEQELAALNMTILYHIPFLRHSSQRGYDEHISRARGYRLLRWVEWLQELGLRFAPKQMCNVHIYICRKPLEVGNVSG